MSLNKVTINREFYAEWPRQTARQAAGYLPDSRSSLEAEPPPVLKPARLEDKLKRVLDISLRMNETHAAKPLLDYVMDQVIELSGAERGLLVLMGPDARMDFEVVRGMAGEEIERTTAQISYTVLAAVAQARQPVLLQDALTDERFGRQSSVLDLNLRSVLCIPLFSRADLFGIIYSSNRLIS